MREICTENGTLLFFDEVISGFRIGFTGAAGYYGIQPDIITYGKIIGGGLPVGAYGASKEIMAKISPEGDVYQAGTLSGNPVAMASGIAQLSACLAKGFYENLESTCNKLVEGVRLHVNAKNTLLNYFPLALFFGLHLLKKKNFNGRRYRSPKHEYVSQVFSFAFRKGDLYWPVWLRSRFCIIRTHERRY